MANECFICGIGCRVWRIPDRDVVAAECPRCGEYSISAQALTGLKQEDRPKLSIATRLSSEAGTPVRILTTNLGSLLADLPRYKPSEQLDLLLRQIEKKTAFVGAKSEFQTSNDFPLVLCATEQECVFLVRALEQRHLLETGGSLRITMSGWERIEEIAERGRHWNQAFVAMSFAPERVEVFDQAINPAIEEAGYNAFRVDRSETLNRIDDEIIAQIRNSRFMVADFTGQRAGVYFEAGLMQGLQRNVIWMCQKNDLSNVHFDTRQYNFIDYETLEEAKERLFNRIIAREGRWSSG